MKKAFLLIVGLLIVKIITNLKNGQTIMESIIPIKSADDVAKMLLKKFEGLASSSAVRLKQLNYMGLYPDHTLIHAYLDKGGKPTIGWGTTFYPGGKAVKMGDTCTIKQANEYFLHEYNLKKADILNKVKVPISNNQLASITSLVYNIGRTAFGTSNLLKLLNTNQPKEKVAEEFTKWVFIKGEFSQALKNRRLEEKNLFLS